ncbi:lipoyl(octanoyl) transferase LipB [Actinotalea subterranea]|uniref:lipoyl(octanoyl) transferase LipB n=1 Tax=Actinotalea subterranea TaxID=2607497 RepID=UPI0011EE6BED|nr:lipoyl(octanoyl) transferase LipB [Actinotalea subterranea]
MDVVRLGLGEHLVEYTQAWALQREIHADVAEGTRPDTLVLVEHEDVYTAGRRTATWDRPLDGTPVVDVDRGGKITWHGPGQLVAYPIVRLAEPVDVVAYVRTLEQAVMDTCAAVGLTTTRVEGRSGVWLPADDATAPDAGGPRTSAPARAPRRERKVAAIGVRVARGVTMHGLALNCTPDLGAFGRIVPCGIADADVTSLSAELARDVTIAEVEPLLTGHLGSALAPLLAASHQGEVVGRLT